MSRNIVSIVVYDGILPFVLALNTTCAKTNHVLVSKMNTEERNMLIPWNQAGSSPTDIVYVNIWLRTSSDASFPEER